MVIILERSYEIVYSRYYDRLSVSGSRSVVLRGEDGGCISLFYNHVLVGLFPRSRILYNSPRLIENTYHRTLRGVSCDTYSHQLATRWSSTEDL